LADQKIPAHARIVIIGGGIIGCSTAYHLAKLGQRDVVLLERASLTSGSTFHAAGLVGQLRSNANVTQLLRYSTDLYDRLEAETGQATGWKISGCLRLACTEARMTEYRRQATMARSFGLDVEILSPKECADRWPLMDAADVIGGCFMPDDGQVNPSDVTQALAKGARDGGVRIIENCAVTGITIKAGRVTGVETDHGAVTCDIVVNCAGQWARDVGLLAGVTVPLVSVQHQYLVTEAISGLDRAMPTIRDPDRRLYFKEEVGGLVAGAYEANPVPWALDGIPDGFNFTLLDADWTHFEPAMTQCLARIPALEGVGIKDLVNGPESFTPDGNFILGAAPDVENFFVGAGFNAFGIASGGGAGRALAEWIADGQPSMDLWPVDIRRFGPHHKDINWVRARSLELYGKHYTIAWPGEEHGSARPVFTSPLYTRLRGRGAVFGEKMGWERPNWFAAAGAAGRDDYSFGRPNWFDAVGAEHRAVRERAALFDQSSFAKFELSGGDAMAALNWLAANVVDKPPGQVTYSQLLNDQGGIECDLTISRFDENRFYIVTGTGFRTRDFAWIRRNLPAGMDATLEDVTDARFTLSLMGPLARQILSQVSDNDLSNAGFPFGACRRITIAGAPVQALRLTYVGELGWELHGRREDAVAVYDALMAAGREAGLVDAGYRAIDSLRLEKGYRAWGADIGPDYTPFEAGLGWAVKLRTDTPFVGRTALESARARPTTRKLMTFTIADPDIVLLGRETIYRDGVQVGWLTSAGWGYTIARNIGLGYVRNDAGIDKAYLETGHYALDIAGRRIACDCQDAPLYDPALTRVKAV
jgi:4-methylaminobutanoate oxidase (formaldehyde-forming)